MYSICNDEKASQMILIFTEASHVILISTDLLKADTSKAIKSANSLNCLAQGHNLRAQVWHGGEGGVQGEGGPPHILIPVTIQKM